LKSMSTDMNVQLPVALANTGSLPVQKPSAKAAKRPRYHNKHPKANKEILEIGSNHAPISMSISPRLVFYRVYTSSNGLCTVVDEVYRAVASRAQHHFTTRMPLDLMRYVVALSWYTRLIDVNSASGYPIQEDTLAMRTALRGIMFPGVICRYIESLGAIILANGASVLPYCANYRELIPIGSDWYFDPLEALEGLHVPDPHTSFSYVSDLVTKYTEASAQFYRCGIELRTVRLDVDGFTELIVGCVPQEHDRVKPVAPERINSSVAELGAAYQWRDYSLHKEWPFGDNEIFSDLFVGDVISPKLVIARNVISSMK